MNFYISDLHIGCQNTFDGRTLEHDKILKNNWNERVTNADTVYILGDIGKEGTNKDNEYLCEIISTLKGRKVLIQGNHEKLRDLRLRQLFTEIYNCKELSDNSKNVQANVVLSHYPILMWNNQHKGWIHLYGHVHQSKEWDIYKNSLKDLNAYFKQRTEEGATDCPQAKAFNVGSMLSYINYTPRTLKEILESGGSN